MTRVPGLGTRPALVPPLREERFLKSARDEAAAQVWQRDLYAGAA